MYIKNFFRFLFLDLNFVKSTEISMVFFLLKQLGNCKSFPILVKKNNFEPKLVDFLLSNFVKDFYLY